MSLGEGYPGVLCTSLATFVTFLAVILGLEASSGTGGEGAAKAARIQGKRCGVWSQTPMDPKLRETFGKLLDLSKPQC